MMRRGLAILILSLVAAAPAEAAEGDGMTQAIAQCLQQNADAVEAAEPDLTKATDYLVADVCVGPVSEEQRRISTERTRQMAERNRAQCLDRVAQQKTQDAIAGQQGRRVADNCQQNYDNLVANTNVPMLLGIGLGNRPPAVVSMAAKLILERRLARVKGK